MSVVEAQLYRNGERVKAVTLDEPIDCKGKSEFIWIGLLEPSEKELKQLEKNFGLHPLAIEDAFKANQLPKVDVYGDQLSVMTRTAHLDDDHIVYGGHAKSESGGNGVRLANIMISKGPEGARFALIRAGEEGPKGHPETKQVVK